MSNKVNSITLPHIMWDPTNSYRFKIFYDFLYKETKEVYLASRKRKIMCHIYSGGMQYNHWSIQIPIDMTPEEYANEVNQHVEELLHLGETK